MRRKFIPCSKTPLEDILIKHKYLTEKDNHTIWESLVYPKFCIHRNLSGKYKGELCLNQKIDNHGYCKKHSPKIKIKCSGIKKNGESCKRNVNNIGQYCKYCIIRNTNKYECRINMQIFIVEDSYKYNSQLVLYKDIKQYIINKYIDFVNNIKIVLNKYNISFDYFLKILYLMSEMEKNMDFHSTIIRNNKEAITNPLSENNLHNSICKENKKKKKKNKSKLSKPAQKSWNQKIEDNDKCVNNIMEVLNGKTIEERIKEFIFIMLKDFCRDNLHKKIVYDKFIYYFNLGIRDLYGMCYLVPVNNKNEIINIKEDYIKCIIDDTIMMTSNFYLLINELVK